MNLRGSLISNKGLKNTLLVATILCFMLYTLPSAQYVGQVWTPLSNYKNWLNVSVNNWNYTATYGTNLFTEGKASTVLVNVSNVINPQYITVIGYDSYFNNLGAICYQIPAYLGTNAILLIPNLTASGQKWNTATIFYNPLTTQSVPLNGCVTSPDVLFPTQASYNGINFVNYVGLNPQINFVGSNSAVANYNFTFNSSIGTSFVVFGTHSDNSLAVFNETWYSDNLNGYSVYASNSTYILKSKGVFTGFVSNVPLVSGNANFLFNGYSPFDNIGYEGYFSTVSNEVVTESMIADQNTGKTYNRTSSGSTGLSPCIPFICNLVNKFFINVTTTSYPQFFTILPAFTRNTIVTGPFINPAPSDNSTFYAFTMRIPITNITWQYNFTTYAYPSNTGALGSANIIHYGPSNTPYLLLTLNYTSQFGPNCYNTYFRSNVNTYDYGPVPFSILSCNSTIASFLLANMTTYGYTYNTVNLYYDSNISGGYSNVKVRNSWLVATGNYLTLSGNFPYVVNLNMPLNANSYLLTTDNIGLYNKLFLNTQGDYELKAQSGIAVNDITGYQATTFLMTASPRYLNSVCEGQATATETLISKNLDAIYALTFSSTTELVLTNTSNCVSDPAVLGASGNLLIQLFNPVSATVTNLFTTSYNAENPQSVNLPNNCVGCNIPAKTYITVPSSATGLNYTNTTTINFASGTLATQVILFGSTSFPRYVFLIIALIIELIGLTMLGRTKDSVLSFAIQIIALWIAGIWYLPILIIAFIISLAFILYEFIL